MLLIRVIRKSNLRAFTSIFLIDPAEGRDQRPLLGEKISDHSRRWHHRFRRDGLDDFVRMLRLSVNVGSSKDYWAVIY